MELIPEILQMVDSNKIALTPAVELSYLTKLEQQDLLETMESEDCTPSLSQAIQLKRLSQTGELDIDRIFDMYGSQGMGYTAIAYALNDMHIPTRKGAEWNFGSIVNILNNEVYLGKIRWGKEPVKKVIKDGMIAKKRFQNDSYELYEGRHEAIITQEQWDLVKAAQKKRGHHSTHITKELQNPKTDIVKTVYYDLSFSIFSCIPFVDFSYCHFI